MIVNKMFLVNLLLVAVFFATASGLVKPIIPDKAKHGQLTLNDCDFGRSDWDPIVLENGGDPDDGGPGFIVENADTVNTGPQWFHFYHTGNDSHVWKSVPTGEDAFVKVCSGWSGRAVRGTEANWEKVRNNLGTWAEHSLNDGDDAFGNISVLEGCDGGIEVIGLDDDGLRRGFTQWIVDDAPGEAKTEKRNGKTVIDKIVGDDLNLAAREFIQDRLDGSQVDVCNDKPSEGIVGCHTGFWSRNGRMKIRFHRGAY